MANLLPQLWEGLKATGAWDWIADVTGLIYVVLVMRQRRAGWVFGGVSSLILAVLAWRARLPMQALLQLSYVVASVYGWWRWSAAGGQRPIAVWHWRGHLVALAGCLLLSLPLKHWFAHMSAFPFIDSLVFCAGMFATWLLARMYLENWVYWIVIDAVSIYLFVAQGLVAIAALFVLYLGIAAVGFHDWWKTWRRRAA
ncbi:MAG TPA: nicotinamide riboside transporter PnuC [Steroidobacteraceae bacterium]|nr:nicotinamide riboside transporter PnuC [Steroidobacteraceae bacterium]